MPPPYTIQPDETTGLDCYFRDDVPAANVNDTALSVGHFPGTPQTRRSLIKFTDFSAVPGGEVITAVDLVLNVDDGTLSSNSATIQAYRVLRAWVETEASWNEYSSGNNWGTAGCDNTSTDRDASPLGTQTVASGPSSGTDITIALDAATVESWHAGGTNNGMLLKVASESVENLVSYSSSAVGTSSNRPKLVVTATSSGPTAPTLVSPISGSTPSPVTFVWTPVEDGSSRDVHFRIMAAASPATVNGDGSLASATLDVHSETTPASFQYESSPGTWAAFPSGGLPAADQTKNVRLTSTMSPGATDWRVRQDAEI